MKVIKAIESTLESTTKPVFKSKVAEKFYKKYKNDKEAQKVMDYLKDK